MKNMKRTTLLFGITLVCFIVSACERKEILTGKREDFLTSVEKTTSISNIKNAAVNITKATSIDSYVEVGGNKEHNSINYFFSKEPKLIWKTKELHSNTELMCYKNKIYFVDCSGVLQCVDTESGKVIWKKSIKDKLDFFGGITISGDKIIVTTNEGEVVVIDINTCKELFRYCVDIPIRSNPTVCEDRVIVNTIDDKVIAFSLTTKKKLWEKVGNNLGEVAMAQTGTPTLLDNENVIVPCTNGDIFSLNTKNGSEVWTDTLFSDNTSESGYVISHIVASPLVYKNNVIAATSESKVAMFEAASGIRVWEQPFGTINSPVVNNGWLFMLTSSKSLVCLEQGEGTVKWEVTVNTETSTEYAERKKSRARRRLPNPNLYGPLLIDGEVCLFTSDGKMIKYNPKDGSQISIKKITNSFDRTPIIVNKTMYAIDNKSRVICLR